MSRKVLRLVTSIRTLPSKTNQEIGAKSAIFCAESTQPFLGSGKGKRKISGAYCEDRHVPNHVNDGNIGRKFVLAKHAQ